MPSDPTPSVPVHEVKVCPACKGDVYAVAYDLGRPVFAVCGRCEGRGYVRVAQPR